MSDIKCVVCGEPWDAYGVNHGDMHPWEAKLFKVGAGCPSCEGVRPESGGFNLETASIFDVENGDEDPMLRILAAEKAAEGTAPEWKRPADETLWTCNDCGVTAIRDADDNELAYKAPYTSRASYDHRFRNSEPEEKPAHVFLGDVSVCEFCFTRCAQCQEPIAPNEGYPDPRNDYHDHDKVCGEDCLGLAQQDEAEQRWTSCYDNRERLDFIREHWQDFDHCQAKWHEPLEAWRLLLANVRGKAFSGSASELCR